MSVRLTLAGSDLSDRWPHIRRALRVDPAGYIDDDFIGWSWDTSRKLSPAEQAAAYEEWADFYEYRLAQRADELAHDPGLLRLVARWTDSMTYCCRRSAARARGEDPGPWVPQYDRRPDLTGFTCRVLDADDDRHADRCLAGAGVAPVNASSDDADDLRIAWGRSVLEPTRGHIREIPEGRPVTHNVRGAVVGMALCGALLIDDLAPEVAAGDFDKCSVCLERLDEIRRGETSPS